STAFFFGYNIVTISAFYWIRKWNWRRVTIICLPIAAAGLLAGSLVQGYAALLAVTAVAGGAFAALYGLGTTILSDTSNPARWFGLKIAAEAGVGAILFLVLPGTLIASHGFSGLVVGMLLTMLLLSPLLWLLPARGVKSHAQEQQEYSALDELPESVNHWAIWSALFAALVFFSGSSAVWAFMERLGNNAGYDSQTIATLLAVTLGCATMGSLGSAMLGKYFGNARPFLVCLLVILCSLLLLGSATDFTTYAMGCCLFTAAFGAGLPFAVSEIAELDVDGRYAVLSVPAIGLGAMIGPGTAGVAYAGDSPVLVLSMVAATMFVAAALMGNAQKRKQR
ncbi:MAG: MFS transporter, partial [Gammaproteobacteria bacterium]|nr:MFS transporter [Gammaproteobacteria bacterium]